MSESVQSAARRAHPDFPFLTEGDVPGTTRFLVAHDWLMPGEIVRRCNRAGEGNMNLTLLVETNRRRFVLKQARPWVEKYDQVAAPWDRILFEQRFYQRIRSVPELARCTPAVLACDVESRVLLLEEIPDARDRADLYAGERLTADEIHALAGFLALLHDETWGAPDPALRNPDMRALNHQHIFVIPLQRDNGLVLDEFEAGLGQAARSIAQDEGFTSELEALAERYLSDGPCLLHGDYFPGSWLTSARGLSVIDPEFCFFGAPEIDLGVAIAHLALARQPDSHAEAFLTAYTAAGARAAQGIGGRSEAFDPRRTARFAAVEVMRRLIGVAQLPIPRSGEGGVPAHFRAELLERARATMRSGHSETLWR